jgi:hypothetical protein
MRLAALPMPAQIHRHDSVPFSCEMLELLGEEAVVAAPAVNQEDRGQVIAGALGLFVKE